MDRLTTIILIIAASVLFILLLIVKNNRDRKTFMKPNEGTDTVIEEMHEHHNQRDRL